MPFAASPPSRTPHPHFANPSPNRPHRRGHTPAAPHQATTRHLQLLFYKTKPKLGSPGNLGHLPPPACPTPLFNQRVLQNEPISAFAKPLSPIHLYGLLSPPAPAALPHFEKNAPPNLRPPQLPAKRWTISWTRRRSFSNLQCRSLAFRSVVHRKLAKKKEFVIVP